jgi:preprotein translocase subunit SecA
MAGRGVDIKLGEGVADLGGLYVLGTERHESRRIDNQLRGRSGRQGDPGESRFYLSAQDEVIRLFAGERIYKILDSRFGPPDGEPIEAKMLTSRIEGAQKKVEEFHFVNRKNVVKYDDVLNEQREQVYATRREILEGEDLHEMVAGWFEDVVEAAVDAHTGGGGFAEDWDWESMWVSLQSIYPIRIGLQTIDREHVTREELLDRIFDDAISSYEAREQEWGEELTRNLERWVVLQVLDVRWREHLDNMDYMRQGIGLRGYAQKDPLVEYRAEGAVMFNEMDFLVKQETVRALMHVEVAVEDEAQYDHSPQRTQEYSYEHDAAATLEALAAAGAAQNGEVEEGEAFPVVEQRHIDRERDVGRNDPCWCGSGKKFKKCHGA